MPFISPKIHYSSDPSDVEYRNRFKVGAAKFIYNRYPWSRRNAERRDIAQRRENKRERDADLRMIEIADRVIARHEREKRNVAKAVKKYGKYVVKKN